MENARRQSPDTLAAVKVASLVTTVKSTKTTVQESSVKMEVLASMARKTFTADVHPDIQVNGVKIELTYVVALLVQMVAPALTRMELTSLALVHLVLLANIVQSTLMNVNLTLA